MCLKTGDKVPDSPHVLYLGEHLCSGFSPFSLFFTACSVQDIRCIIASVAQMLSVLIKGSLLYTVLLQKKLNTAYATLILFVLLF